MKRKLRMTAVAALAATGVALGTAAASPAVAAQTSQAKASCWGGYYVNKADDIVGDVTWCPNGDTVSIKDMTADGYTMGVRVSDGSGKYRWCKASGVGKTTRCNFDLRENKTITIRGYLERKGHATIWVNTHTYSN
ncbi:hypothetical protein ACFYXH_13640 [Streptomyces sp. NPDC002730]|uniref:hypothetical protein n=1 Tax=Streptomyces sp. NPDC002730 TaxID=3364662 RepID=UPI00368253DB